MASLRLKFIILRISLALALAYLILQQWLHFFPYSQRNTSPPPKHEISETLVVACAQDDDMSWLAGHFPSIKNVTPSHSSKGNEVLAYLQYIVDNYDSLSDITIFIHNHDAAWHNNALPLFSKRMSRMLARLDRSFVLEGGYFNLRCDREPGCHPAPRLNFTQPFDRNEEDRELDAMRLVWQELHPDDELPDVLAQPCCSQFAASRERIKAVPLARWVHFRDWVLQTEMKSWLLGRVWEYTWQFVLSRDHGAVWCPSEADCYCYGYGVCFGSSEWEELKAMEKEVDQLKQEYMALLARGNDDAAAAALHERILAGEGRVGNMLEAAVKNGFEGKGLRDASTFRVS
ncbi:hypothetical protein B0H66DRAFT_534252 [Apodospora peruviana]|uniref:Uncharacterized protein n=1 Tax=Apodospora peruviana TaxID=516989 RepID=A0AAE0I0F4_9PEZI|nr:hypothetical protein B0H66DRAFT_534252 [Apodospora peruviana]